jgi:cytochrome c oxidase subunit 1
MKLSSSFKNLLLIEIIFPIVLLTLGIYHGLIQSLARAGIIRTPSFFGLEYYQGLTLHGVINAIVLTTFFAVAFGHAVIAYALNKKINLATAWTSLILMVVGVALTAWSILAGKASVLYTFYPPLQAHPLFYIGLTLAVVGSWVALASWIPPYLSWRKENPNAKVPLAVLGVFTTFIVWFLATLPVAYEILFMLLPWSLGWTPTVNILLSRTLFWFFGHPLVYFWLLPAYTMFYTMLPKVAGGKLFSDRAGRLAFFLFIVLSIPVGVHHQYTEPAFREGVRLLHAILTFGVALPSFITAFTIAASLEYAARQNGGKGLFSWWFKLPYFSKDRWLFSYLFVGLVIFFFGGITGIMNASPSMDMVVHNTSWMPGHFHLTVAGPVFLGILAMTLLFVSQLTGKEIKFKSLTVAVPYLWMAGLFLFSTGMMLNGIHGEPRRTHLGLTYLNPDSPLFVKNWVQGAHLSLLGGLIMTSAALSYFVVFFSTLFGKKVNEIFLELPLSETYHDEPRTAVLDKLWPWIVVAILLIVVAYVPAIQDAINGTTVGAPGFSPNSPMPLK